MAVAGNCCCITLFSVRSSAPYVQVLLKARAAHSCDTELRASRSAHVCSARPAAAAAETCARASPSPLTRGGGGGARRPLQSGRGRSTRSLAAAQRRQHRKARHQEHRSTGALVAATLRSFCMCVSNVFSCSTARAAHDGELLLYYLHAGVRKKLPPCLILSYRFVSQPAPARPLPPPAPPRMRLAAAALLLAAACRSASAFPVYSSANGSVLVASALGGDVVFAPSAGGALQALCARRALP